MITQTLSQSSISNFPPIPSTGKNINFNDSTNGGKKLSHHDIEILDYNTKENKSSEKQSKKIKISRSLKDNSKKLQSLENIQDKSLGFDIEFLDFNSNFTFEIVEIEADLPSTEIFLYLKFNDNILKITLLGDWRDNEGFYLNDFGFSVEKQGETPTSIFLLKTFWAMLGLSSKVKIQIPNLNQKATFSFDTKLDTVTEMLQIRQIAYRLMVIEKTFNTKLPFPQYIDGKYVERISYCFHSIIERKFQWICPSATIPWTATQTYLSLLPDKNVPFPIQFRPEIVEKEIFGHSINLGLQTAKIEEYLLDNFDEIKRKLSKLDGSEVLAQTRSKNGTMQIESLTTPILPNDAFSPEIQKLIDLEEQLDSVVMEKYFSIVASSLEGLTEDQKEAVLQRPNLDEDAFDF